MEASVVMMPAVGNQHAEEAIPHLKDNNAESRMNTSSEDHAITLDDNGRVANELKDKRVCSNHNSQEAQNSQSSTVEESNATTASTPPTSDGFSSQESQLSQLSVLAAAQEPFHINGPDSSRTTVSSAGQKRTASGMVKPPVAKSPTSPAAGSNGGGHARSVSNISSASNLSSRIGERSAELRARLSYAMVKVNNGWQSLPFDEVESRVSQATSPTSSTSTLQGRRNRITSPRTAIANVQTENNSNRPFSSSAPVLGASNTLASLTTDQPSRTYESFWREHSVNANPTNRHSVFQPHPSLAPPADLFPSSSSPSRNVLHHPRRTDPGTSRPPVMPIKTVSDLSQSSLTSPHTPTKDSAIDAMLRTPSQKSAQEQDAIESLLFMSSPGNSTTLMHNFPPPHQPPSNQQSPLRSEFNIATTNFPSSQAQSRSHQQNNNNINRDNHSNANRIRRVGFSAEEEDGSSEGGYSISRVPSGNGERIGTDMRRVRMAGDEVDKILDAMEDESSDEDDIDLLTTPRRNAVSRVDR